MLVHTRILKMVVFAVGACVALPTVAQTYTVTDLGSLGGTFSNGNGINATGQVAGSSRDTAGNPHPFRWTPNSPNSPLGSTSYIALPSGTNLAGALAINLSGQLAGSGTSKKGNSTNIHGYIWNPNGSVVDIKPIKGNQCEAYGINTLGQVVGWTSNSTSSMHAFLWANGVIKDIGIPNGSTDWAKSLSINASGTVVGMSGVGGWIWQPTSPNAMTGTMTLLGPDCNAINDSGQIAGTASGHAALNTGGVWQDLGTLGGPTSNAFALNNLGQVVGYSDLTATTGTAFVYSGGVMRDLNTMLDPVTGAGWFIQRASGINNYGQIVGYGRVNGQTRAFLLTPQ